ncbi:hypothetical protein [Actinoplanes sp. NPDC051494]|uniref:hypothetical protein n=1 Tax=Actinoplanes sp. NPDC051494 TaxID=3363907 RepID=UPI0037A3CCA9
MATMEPPGEPREENPAVGMIGSSRPEMREQVAVGRVQVKRNVAVGEDRQPDQHKTPVSPKPIAVMSPAMIRPRAHGSRVRAGTVAVMSPATVRLPCTRGRVQVGTIAGFAEAGAADEPADSRRRSR